MIERPKDVSDFLWDLRITTPKEVLFSIGLHRGFGV